MKVLALHNVKGGVGKTASAVNLSFLAAQQGARTLVWDLDPQGAASFYFRVRPKVKGGGKRLVRGKRPLDAAIKGTDFDHLDLLPADFSYRNLDLLLDRTKKPLGRLKRLVAPLADDYDYLFLDCAPSVSLVSEAVYAAADALLVPVIPTTLSLRTLGQLAKHLRKLGMEHLEVLPFFCMVDRRKKLHREICAAAGDSAAGGFRFLAATIPYSSLVEQMGVHRSPLATYASPASAPARAYRRLWDDIRSRVCKP